MWGGMGQTGESCITAIVTALPCQRLMSTSLHTGTTVVKKNITHVSSLPYRLYFLEKFYKRKCECNLLLLTCTCDTNN